MDYNDVPKNVLDLAVKVSKAAKAEYWACDIAYEKNGDARILECATAFAAFPYIRDWIGKYIMWNVSEGRFEKPYIPLFNWEELGKVSPDLLRTMRDITFGKYYPSYDGAYLGTKKIVYGDSERYLHELDDEYKIYDVKKRWSEEWPSENYNYQDRFSLNNLKSMKVPNLKKEDAPSVDTEDEEIVETIIMSQIELEIFLKSVSGIGDKKYNRIIEEVGSVEEVVGILHQSPSILLNIKGITKKIIENIKKQMTTLQNKELDLIL